jgi:hypothetical protein
MIRKAVFAAAAVAMTFAAIPAQAGALYGSAPIVEEGGYKQDVGHFVLQCKIVRVKSYYGWKNVKKCHKVWPKHKVYNTY